MSHKLSVVYDEISTWDCDFTFEQAEIEEWRHEDFYLFLLGQFVIQGKFNSKYKNSWKDSKYYFAGKNRAFRVEKPKKTGGLIVRPFRSKISVPKPTVSKKERTYKIVYNGDLYKIRALESKKVRIIPKIGMNITRDAIANHYHYYIQQSKYIFVHDRTPLCNSIDLTNVLLGRGLWPDVLSKITLCFDADRIVKEGFREYHFINYILRKRRTSYATYADWLEFRLLADTATKRIY